MKAIRTYKLDNKRYIKHIELDEELSQSELVRLWKLYGNGTALNFGPRWVTETMNSEIIADTIRR